MECKLIEMSFDDLVFCVMLGYILSITLIIVGSAMLWDIYKSFELNIPDILVAVCMKVLGWTFVIYITLQLTIC